MIQPEVVVVVPCFNEAQRLSRNDFLSFVDHHRGFHFLFVDDGSHDATVEILEGLKLERPDRFSILNLERNFGKAEAVRRGFLDRMTSGVPYLAFWDADLATPLEVLPYFLKAFDEQPRVEMVLGARVKLLGHRIKRHELLHYLGRVFATLVSLVLNLAVYDTQCGAKMFRVTDTLRDIFQKPFCSRWIFDVEILARYKKIRGIKNQTECESLIYELPLRQWEDVQGSKLHPADFFKAFFELIEIDQRYR